MSSLDDVIYLKKKGDTELNYEHYHQAWKYYTDAIQLLETVYEIDEDYGVRTSDLLSDSYPNEEAKILSKRSVASLKMRQYYYAHEDAKQIISIHPDWFKGYLRKADVEAECSLFEESMKNYHLALRCLSTEKKEDHRIRYTNYLNQSIKQQLFYMQRERIFDYQLIWIGTALGLIVGMAVVSWDFVNNKLNSYINHPLLKLFIIGFFSFIFYYLTSVQRYFSQKYREKLLQPPHKEKMD